jgi:hypothetical protein
MARNFFVFVMVLTLSSWAAAQSGNKSGKTNAALTPADTTCAFTFHSGSNWTETQYCVTANGNITQFSNPAGSDNIAGVWPSEGYGVCDFFPATPVGYYDYAPVTGSGNSRKPSPSYRPQHSRLRPPRSPWRSRISRQFLGPLT